MTSTADFSRTLGYTPDVIIQDKITETDARDCLNSAFPPVIYTPHELEIFQGFMPTVIHHLDEIGVLGDIGDSFREVSDDIIGQRVAWWLQSELFNRFATTCTALVHGLMDPDSVNSKLAQLKKFGYVGGKLLGIPGFYDVTASSPSQVSGDLPPEQLDNILFQVKLASSDLLRKTPLYVPPGYIQSRIRTDVVEDERFGYVHEMTGVAGEYPDYVFVYGSAVTDPEKCNDTDYMVFVDRERLGDWVMAFRGTHPTFKGKKVEINIYPADTLEKVIAFEHDPREFAEQTILVYGNPEVPVVPEEYNRMRIYSHVVSRCKQIKTILLWAAGDPDILLSKPNFHDFVIKTPRFMLRGIWNLEDGYAVRTKDEISGRLTDEFGYRPIPVEQCDAADVRENLIQVYTACARLIEYIHPIKAELPFLEGVPLVPF